MTPCVLVASWATAVAVWLVVFAACAPPPLPPEPPYVITTTVALQRDH